MWALHPTQWALRPTEIQTHSQCDIIRLNDRSSLLTLRRHHRFTTLSSCFYFIDLPWPCLWWILCLCQCWVCPFRRWNEPSVGEWKKILHRLVFAVHISTVRKPCHLTRQVSVWRLDVDDCKCCSLRSIYSQWLISHRTLTASLRIRMSGQKRGGFINPPHNDIGQRMDPLEQLY